MTRIIAIVAALLVAFIAGAISEATWEDSTWAG